jgi:hypothetical protein
MGGAAGSRRTIARASGLASDEESRGYLQGRLEALSELMFWSFVVLLAFMALMYWQYPDREPRHENVIVYISSAGLLLLACAWRFLLARGRLTIQQLYGIDMFYAIGTGVVLGASGYLASDKPISGPACLIYAGLMVLVRAILVPSSGRRTAVIASLTMLPIAISAVAVGMTSAPVQQLLPPPAYIGGAVIISAVVVMLASVGSQTIYGLRRRVSEVMQLGQYTLDRRIGVGGMGEVWRAHHALLRRPTAIKLLLPDLVGVKNLDRFEREVQSMSQLTHPNTVAVFDYGRNLDGVFYYAMEYLDGIDLQDLVTRYGPQPADRVVNIVAQVCGALTEAHASGIIHRDIKPANIILCRRGGMADVAKVIDFGLVKEIADDTGASTQAILGTPGYLAPEAVLDPGSIGPPVDLYALGAAAYFLLTGEVVFDGTTAMDTCVQHVRKAPVPPSHRGSPCRPRSSSS